MFSKSLPLMVVLVGLAAAGEITFRDCGSVGRSIEKVEVTNCNKTKCDVVKGQRYDVLVYFTSGEGGEKLDIDMRGKATIIVTPILVTENGEGCDGLNFGCPFPGGVRLVHNTSVVVGEQFFETEALITHKLIDDARRTQVCIETDVTIVAPV